MKFYQIDTDVGPQLVVRKDEAKKLDPSYKAVEIPTDSAGLRAHLNALMAIKHAREAQEPYDGVEVPITANTSEIIPAGAENPATIARDDKWSAKSIIADLDKPKPKQADKLFEPDDIVDLILDSRGFRLANYFGAVLEAAERAKKELT